MSTGLADLAVELHHRTAAELQQLADLHRGPAQHGRDLDRDVIDGAQLLDRGRDRIGDAADRSGSKLPTLVQAGRSFIGRLTYEVDDRGRRRVGCRARGP